MAEGDVGRPGGEAAIPELTVTALEHVAESWEVIGQLSAFAPYIPVSLPMTAQTATRGMR